MIILNSLGQRLVKNRILKKACPYILLDESVAVTILNENCGLVVEAMHGIFRINYFGYFFTHDGVSFYFESPHKYECGGMEKFKIDQVELPD